MIRFDHVSFGYPAAGEVIRDLSFTIKKGEFAALIGENGAGKSTSLRLVNGLLKPSSGTVTMAGMDTSQTKISALAKHVGFLFQNPDRQLCQNTVGREIAFGLELAGKKNIEAKVDQMIKTFGFDPAKDPFTLSRGERQRVALASIIATEPEILILDEPTTGLDYLECMQVMEAVQRLNQNGVTVVMVCHDMEVVLDFAERLLVLSCGKLIADGKTAEIFRQAGVMEAASLLPPQITQLALRLGEGFEGADTVDEMVLAVSKKGVLV